MRLGPARAATHTAQLAAVHDSLASLIHASRRLGWATSASLVRVPSFHVSSLLDSASPAVTLSPVPPVATFPTPLPPVTDHTTHTRPLKWRPPRHLPYPGSCCPSPGASGGGQTSASTAAANFQTLSRVWYDMHLRPAKMRRLQASPSSWNSQRGSTRPRTAPVCPGRTAPSNNTMADPYPARRYPLRGGESTPA